MSEPGRFTARLAPVPFLWLFAVAWLSLPWRRRAAILGALALLGGLVYFGSRASSSTSRATIVTLGEIEAVHPEVRLDKSEVRGIRRFSVGDQLSTGSDGRARIRLDDGTIIVVDRATELEVTPNGLKLASGRLFVRNGSAAREEISAGAVTTVVSASAVAFEKKGEDARIYSADGELVVRAADKQDKVRSGESAVFSGGKLSVVPEKAFNDWTGGMATPWSTSASGGSAVGQLIGRSSPTEGGSNLAIRSHEISAKLEGEVAMTHVETTFFNGTSDTLNGDFRMATPPGAIVSRFALRHGEALSEGKVIAGSPTATDTSSARLEWAGPGWLRGNVPNVAAGETVGVIVDYVEWLSVKDGRMTYRYPMASDAAAPLIGELRAQIDAHGVAPRSITVGKGASVTGDVVEVRKSDLRPDADLVVELEVAEPPLRRVRGYSVPAGKNEPNADPYFMVRAELPANAAPPGVTLALVLDTSWSISPALLEVERAVVESLVAGLGARDRVAVFAAAQDLRPVGGTGLGSVDEARRQAIRDGLSTLRSGGASDLGAALEAAANTLPSDAPDAMLVYVGDGWPTLGDASAEALRARLARRAGGVPRLGAVAVGPLANRFGLAALVRDSGPVLVALDRADAANLAISLLVGALDSATPGVELDLGPNVDRVYPRGPATLRSGEALTVVGRLRGDAPKSVWLRYRSGNKLVVEQRSVAVTTAPSIGDVRRRWASARVADITLRGESIETATDVAERAKLLTPWTLWSLDSEARYVTPLALRLLDPLGASQAMPPSALSLPERSLGSLLEPGAAATPAAAPDFEALMTKSVHRMLRSALPGIRRCRDARRSLKPELGGTLNVHLSVDGRGRASSVQVHARDAIDDDAALDRCVATLVTTLPFFDAETTGSVVLDDELALAPHDTAARHCSQTSALPLLLRPLVWQRRLHTDKPDAVFLRAARECELPGWVDQRALMELLLSSVPAGADRVSLAFALDAAGATEAASYIRDAAIARAKDPVELTAVRQALIGDEPEPGATFYKQYKDAKDNEARLAVVRRFLRASPHNATLRRLLFALLEALGKNDVLAQELEDVRRDPFADGELLANGASALRRVGRADDARRAFAELIERAPDDPFARAFAGNRLRDEGLFDDATSAYETLSQMLPGDPAAALSLGLAHAGAGRMDVAARVFQRVAETGGRANDTGLGELASMTAAVLLTDAKNHASGADARRLEQRALELPLPDLAGFVLVQTPDLDVPLEARLAQGDDKVETPPDLAAPTLGLYALRLERGSGDVRIRLRRPLALGPERGVAIRVDVLSTDRDSGQKKLAEKRIELSASGKDTELRWTGAELL